MSMQGRHKTGQALMHAILTLVAIYTLAPLVFLIFNSFKSNNEIVDSPVSAPSSWSFQYIISAAQQIHFFRHLDHLCDHLHFCAASGYGFFSGSMGNGKKQEHPGYCTLSWIYRSNADPLPVSDVSFAGSL